jgi:hypothetical protein
MNEHRRPAVGFWITLALVVLLVGYPLSVGPAIWLRANVFDDSVYESMTSAFGLFYAPLFFIADRMGWEWAGRALTWYLSLWVDLLPS